MEAQRLAHWSRGVRGGGFCWAKIPGCQGNTFWKFSTLGESCCNLKPAVADAWQGHHHCWVWGAAGFAQGFGARKQNKMGQKEKKSDWEHLILPDFQDVITGFFSPHHVSQKMRGLGGVCYLISGLNCWAMGRGEVCVPGGWGEEEGERGGKRDTGFWPPAKKNN